MRYESQPDGALVDAQVNAQAWNRIAAQDTAEAGTVPDRIEWTCWAGRGPGSELLGDITGRRVAELGCGTGEHLAHVATSGARLAIGVDVAEQRIAQARARFGHLPAIVWQVGDAAEVLADLPQLDVCYSIYGALWYSDPIRLLPSIHRRLRTGGVLAFSANAPRPGQLPGRRVDNLTLTGDNRLPVVHYAYCADEWARLLGESGFTADEVLAIDGPEGSPHRTLVLRAHRRGG